jgi:hypothetical protein
MTPRTSVEDTIARYQPTSVGEEAAGFARLAVGKAGPTSRSRAKSLLFAASRLGGFGLICGLELTDEVLFHPSVIERFIVVGCDEWSSATRRTLRTDLRFLARAVDPGCGPAPVALSRERAKTPYTGAQLAAYLALADAQPTSARRHRLSALVCLGAGAGLMGADLRGVSGNDVVCRSGGVLVVVRGRRPRVVPVLACYHARLVASAAHCGEGFVVGGVDEARRNVTARLVATASGGVDLPRLDTGRLRSTWLAAVAEALGLRAFMDAAGISCSQRLGDVVATLEPVDEETAVARLGGSRSIR